MNAKDIVIRLKTVADIQDVLSNTKQIQNLFNKLKLPAALTESARKTFDSIEKQAEKASNALASGFKKKSDVTQYTSAMATLNTLLNQIPGLIHRISEADLSNSIDFKEVDKLVQQVQTLQQTLSQGISNTDAYKKIADAYKQIASTSSSTKRLDAFMKALNSGDLNAASEALKGVAQSQRQVNAESEKGKQYQIIIDGFKNIVEQLPAPLQEVYTEILKCGEAIDNFSPEQMQAFKDALAEADRVAKDTAKQQGELGAKTEQTAVAQQNLNSELDQFKGKIAYFFGMNNAVNLFQRALRAAFNTVQDLDKVMTQTAVVTEFSVGDMWSQLPEYTRRANELGVSIHSAYEAATIYYQQGLKTNEVMAVSNETLKMARIAGLDAATATDRMTNALRGFNMEINESNAQNINDVYSKLAAITAANTDEISTAMTKVASLAHNANMSFENTAAFLAQIIETTRESAETAGTALKTVVARFSEVKSLYSEGELLGTDAEGEAIDINKVSKALRTAGINLNEYLTGAKGLDEIFIELSSKWNTLTTVQQRYIATMAAGSRQQSRFIALMSDYARTTQLVEAANNAAGAGQAQYEKTLESLETKLTRLSNAWNEFLMTIANSDVIKIAVDALTGLITAINKLTDGLPGLLSGFAKIAIIWGGFKLLKPIINNLLGSVGSMFMGKAVEFGKLSASGYIKAFSQQIKSKGGIFTQSDAQVLSANISQAVQKAIANGVNIDKEKIAHIKFLIDKGQLDQAQDELIEIEELQNYIKDTPLNPPIDLNRFAALGATLGGVFFTISNIIDKGDDPNAKKIAEVLNTIGTTLMTISVILPIVGKGIEALGGTVTKAGIEMTIAGNATTLAWWPLTLILAGIIAAIAVVAVTVKAIDNEVHKVENLRKEAEDARKAATEAQDAYNELLDKKTEHENLINQISSLEQGTLEWKEAVAKNNQEVLKLIDSYKLLAKYVTYANGVYSISDEGWKKYEENYSEIIQSNYRSAFSKEVEAARTEARRLTNKDLKDEYELRHASEGLTYDELRKEKEHSAVAELVRQYAPLIASEYTDNENFENITSAILNSNIFDKTLEDWRPTIQGNAAQKTIFKSAALRAIPGIGPLLGSINDSVGLQKATLEEAKALYKDKTGKDYDELLELSGKELSEKDQYKDISDKLDGLYSTDNLKIVYEELSKARGSLKKIVELDLDAYEDNIKYLLDGLDDNTAAVVTQLNAEQKKRRDSIDNLFKEGWGIQDIEGIFESYNKAYDFYLKFDTITSGFKIGDILKNLLSENQGLLSNKDFQDQVLNLDLSSAIDGFEDLQNTINNTTGTVQNFFMQFKEQTKEAYNLTSQANELYKSFSSDELENLAKDGAISASELNDLAKTNVKLQKVLKNTGVSANTLATYFTKIHSGALDAADATTEFVTALDKVKKSENIISEMYSLIDSFSAGDSITKTRNWLDEVKKGFNELYELGAYGDNAIINYEKLILGEDAEAGTKEAADNAKAIIDSFYGSFYQGWVQTANRFPDLVQITEDGTIEITTKGLKSLNTLITAFQESTNSSIDIAKMALAEFETYSETARTEFKKIAFEEGLNDWLKTGVQLGANSFFDEKQLKALAEEAGADFEEIKAEIEKQFKASGNTGFIGLLFDNEKNISADFAKTLGEQLKRQLSRSYDDKAVLTSYYNSLRTYYNLNKEEATKALKEIAKYTSNGLSESTIDGLVKGIGDDQVKLAEQEETIETSRMFARAVTVGMVQAFNSLYDLLDDTELEAKLKTGIDAVDDYYDGEIEALEDMQQAFSIYGDKLLDASTITSKVLSKVTGSVYGYGAPGSRDNTTGTGTGTGSSKSSLGDPYTELFNIEKQIAARIRERTKLEREYERMLADENTTTEDLRKNYFAQLEKLQARAEEEYRKQYTAQALRDNLGTRLFQSGDVTKSFADWDVTKYMWLDNNGVIKRDTQALNEISDPDLRAAVEEYMKLFEEYTDQYNEAEDNIEEIREDCDSLQQSAIDSYLDFEDRVKDAFIAAREKELERLGDLIDSVNNFESEMISKIQEQVNESRKIRKNTETEKNIADKEARLAYLRRDTSGANALEIKQLEQELGEARQDYSDTLVDQAIEQMQKDAEDAAKQRAMQLEALQEIHRVAVETGAYWPEIHQLMEDAWSEAGTLKRDSKLVELLQGTESFKSLSKIGQQQWYSDLKTAANGAAVLMNDDTWKDGIGGIIAANTQEALATTDSLMASALKNVQDDYQNIYNGVITNLEAYNSSLLSYLDKISGQIGKDPPEVSIEITIGGKDNTTTYTEESYKARFGKKSGFDALTYATGGLADYTGPAWLDGTKTHPEMVLSPTDTRNFIALRDVLAKLVNGNEINGAGGDAYYDIDINAEIGSDYDVDRLADRIKKEITESSNYRNVNTMNFIR